VDPSEQVYSKRASTTETIVGDVRLLDDVLLEISPQFSTDFSCGRF
jgi:hypothetical protein